MDTKAKELLRNLSHIQSKLKIGDPEREREEDLIYKEMYSLAQSVSDQFKTEPQKVDNESLDFYFLVHHKQLAHMKQRVSYPVLYQDEDQLFPRKTASPKTLFFTKQLAEQVAHMTPEEISKVIQNPKVHAPRELFRKLMFHQGRTHALKESENQMCKGCRKELVQQLWQLMMEILLIELDARSQQLFQWYKEHNITREDYVELTDIFNKVLDQVEAIINDFKPKEIADLEFIFMLMIQMINEMLMRFVMMQQVKNPKLAL